MDLVPYLSAVILISTIATILLALLSYAAFKLRDRRRPNVSRESPIFFHRFSIDEADETAAPETGERQQQECAPDESAA